MQEAQLPAGKTPVKAALASWIGSTLEYYDFFIYGTAAALVFDEVFFPESSPATGTLLALATFGVGYIARPIGGFLLGHLGDRFGRRRVLIFTLTLMGTATFLIGCLPTYEVAGVAAPILLVALRLLQGLSAGGEQSSANAVTWEHAPENRRAFFTSWTLSGTQAGSILATSVFLPVAVMPHAQLISWGWRIPFWLSVVVLVVGYLIRRNLHEAPEFASERNLQRIAKIPAVDLFRHQPLDVLRVIFASMFSSVSTVFAVFGLAYAVKDRGLSQPTMLWVGIVACVVALLVIPLWGILSDRIGRKPVFIFGTLGSGALMFGYLWAISGGSYPLIFTFGLLLSGVVYSAANANFPALFGEMFATPVRLSGTAIGTQIGFALAGFAPTIAQSLKGPGDLGWLPVAIFTAVASGIAAIAVATGRETYRTPLRDLGRKQSQDQLTGVSTLRG